MLGELGVNPDNGVAELYTKIQDLPEAKRAEIEADIEAVYRVRPELAMVNSSRGITNLHVPSDVIIDASMPALIRQGGKGWGPDGELHDVKCVIPDSSYAAIYDETINFCKEHGAFNPAEMGSIPNVGLMAQKAEEYGSHPQTFEVHDEGTIRILDNSGAVLISQIFGVCVFLGNKQLRIG